MQQRGRHRRNTGFLGRRSVRVGLLTLVVLGLTFSGTAFAGYRYDQARANRLLPGITIDGVDVGGMTREGAIRTLQGRVDARLERTLSVDAAGKALTVTPLALGSTADIAASVDEGLALSEGYSWTHRVFARLMHKPVNRVVPLRYQFDERVVAEWLDEVAVQRNLSPQSAAVDWVDDHLVLSESKSGRALKKGVAAEALLSALEGQAPSVKLPFKSIAPKVTEDELGHTIVVRTGINKLYLYEGIDLVKEYGVATGSPGYPTPHGQFTIINKRENPTWVNPAPDGWGRGLPASIGPGPGNPLGTRALDLDAPGIRIHGTYADYSIGSAASHGCIRMHIPENEELFSIVDVGTPVIIVY
jgi:lipoprotein-anchoring transpeptidase ErfK/SrfK